jgi:pyrroline-5-carboxylate reductase
VLDGKRVGLIGAGVMAEVIAGGLIRSKLVRPSDIIMSHYRHDRLKELERIASVRTTESNREAYEEADVCVLCVRPQAMTTILEELKPLIRTDILLISIAAGLPISFYESELGRNLPFVRCMPTFFGRIKAGTSGFALSKETTADHLALASRLFDTVSEHVIVMPEEDMDAFTTFGSTTTAAVYLLLDALITAGSIVGLRHQMSHSRAIEQVVAAARNIMATDKLPSQLLDEICTPGGVTVEGVKVLEERAVRGAVIDAIIAATDRAKELRRTTEE